MSETGLGASLLGSGARKARDNLNSRDIWRCFRRQLRTGGHGNGRSNLCTDAGDAIAMYEVGAIQLPALLNHGSRDWRLKFKYYILYKLLIHQKSAREPGQ
jgi:hypothetical protein